jgi:hypothetical protein
VLAGRGSRLRQLARGPGKPRRGRGLDEAVPVDVGSPRGQVRIGGGFAQRQHRFGAGLGPGEGRRPLVPGPFGEPGGQPRAQLRPVPRIAAVGHVGQPEPGQQRGVEARLERADGHPLAVRRLVHVVPGHAAVQQVHPPLVPPVPLGQEHQRHGQQRRHPVHDGRVHDLSPARAGPLDQGRADAVGHQHPAAAKIAEQVRRELRRTAGPAQRVQRADAGDVADVVPDGGGQRAVLPPARHTRVDQPRVAGQADLGPHAETFGHPRPQALEQDVRGVGQPEQRVHRARVLQVEHGGLAAAVHQVTFRPGFMGRSAAGPVDAQHGGALVGQEHGAERSGPDARKLEHPQAGQRPAAGSLRHRHVLPPPYRGLLPHLTPVHH